MQRSKSSLTSTTIFLMCLLLIAAVSSCRESGGEGQLPDFKYSTGRISALFDDLEALGSDDVPSVSPLFRPGDQYSVKLEHAFMSQGDISPRLSFTATVKYMDTINLDGNFRGNPEGLEVTSNPEIEGLGEKLAGGAGKGFLTGPQGGHLVTLPGALKPGAPVKVESEDTFMGEKLTLILRYSLAGKRDNNPILRVKVSSADDAHVSVSGLYMVELEHDSGAIIFSEGVINIGQSLKLHKEAVVQRQSLHFKMITAKP